MTSCGNRIIHNSFLLFSLNIHQRDARDFFSSVFHVSIIIFLVSTVCTARIDLGFLIEGTSTFLRSGSQKHQNVIQFIRETARRFKISQKATRIAIITYAFRPKSIITFTGSHTLERIYGALNGIRAHGGRGRLGSALYYAKQTLFGKKPRCGRRRVLIVVSGGASMDQVRRPAIALQGAGVEIFMVGVGRVDTRILLKVATDSAHVFLVGFTRVNTIIRTLKDRICYSPGRFLL